MTTGDSAFPDGGPGITWPTHVVRPDDLHHVVFWSAAELSIAIRHRVVTCEEVMQAHLDHIEQVNPKVNAIVSLRPRSELMTEARDKDRLLDDGAYQGWMHGFPQAVKDLADVAGLPSSYGLVHPSEDVPVATEDSLFVSRIRAAGAIFIGKTNTPELGLGSHTYNNVFGTTVNAFDQTKSAGGSSGGAAVAVAMRMLPVADGSDFMGSLRNPPGWNNVFGLRPSFGRIPTSGEVYIDQGGVIGPIARTALDLALLLRTISGYDDRAPLSIEQDPGMLTDLHGKDVAGRKVAWLGDLGGYLPMEDEVLSITGHALQHFGRLGMTVDHLETLPSGDGFAGTSELWRMWLTYRHWLAGMSVKWAFDIGLGEALKPEAVYEYSGLTGSVDGGPISAVDIYQNSEKRSSMYRVFQEVLHEYNYVVLPTAQVMPFDANIPWPQTVAGAEMTSYHRWMEVSTIGTLLGVPVLARPAGVSPAGLPIGLQVIGRNHDEVSLLELAQAWEQETGLIRDHLPPLLR